VIFGIGTDIVSIARIADNLARYGERFAARILSDAELDLYRSSPRQAHFLAKRFAAKEAAAKALGTGIRDGLSLRDIRVENDPLGKPLLAFSPTGEEKLRQRGIQASHLSLADEEGYAIAFVTLECTENRAGRSA
jgi:holo-[acyl-carrier protein] synthase